jgi:hypothetical protein
VIVFIVELAGFLAVLSCSKSIDESELKNISRKEERDYAK